MRPRHPAGLALFDSAAGPCIWHRGAEPAGPTSKRNTRLALLLDAVGAVLRPADPSRRRYMFQIFLAAQLLGFILGGSAFLLRYDHV